MDWIHCNACSHQPSSEKGRKFLLTSCGHIYCNSCVEAATKPACRVCKTVCTSIQLTSQMPPNIQHYFADPEDMMRKAMQVFTFQRGHRQRLSSLRSSSTIAEHLAIVKENKELKNQLALQKRQITLLEQKIVQLKKACNAYANILTPVVQQQRGSSPANTPKMQYPPSASSVCSQKSMCGSLGGLGLQTGGEKRISPYFSPVGFPTPGSGKNSPVNSKSMQGENYKKFSPRERFLNFMP